MFYPTERLNLEICDALAESIRTGQPYQTRLDPPPRRPALLSSAETLNNRNE